jgi:hypothetical protein
VFHHNQNIRPRSERTAATFLAERSLYHRFSCVT